MKEIGVGIFNCSCLAQDLDKLFEVYWYLGNQTTVPPKWPEEFATAYNLETPMQLKLNGTNATAFIGVSYKLFNASVTPLRILLVYCPNADIGSPWPWVTIRGEGRGFLGI